MLRIRRQQMSKLSAHMLRQFEDRMVVRLRTRFPAETGAMDEPELRQLVQEGIEQANAYDVTAEFDVQRYLECMVEHGRDFDTAPETAWAGDILRTGGLTGAEKMDRIDDYETFGPGRIGQ